MCVLNLRTALDGGRQTLKELGFTAIAASDFIFSAPERAQPLHILVASGNDCAPLLHCRELKSGRRMRALQPDEAEGKQRRSSYKTT